MVARLFQGVGAALFLPASLALVREAFHAPAERARAIATWAGIASVAAAAGPVLGGVLVQALGWRSVFVVNVPAGLLVLALTVCVVRSSASRDVGAFDWAGQLTAFAFLGSLCLAAIEFPSRGAHSPVVIGALAASVLAAYGWRMAERRALEPMVPLIWWRNGMLMACNALGGLVYVGYFGMLFALSLLLQGRLRLDPRHAGLALLPLAASLPVGNLIAGRLQARLGSWRLIAGSVLMSALATPLIAWQLTSGGEWGAIGGAMAVFGVGTAASVPPMIAVVLEQVPAKLSGIASGLLNATRQLGSLLGVAAASAAATLMASLQGMLWAVALLAATTYLLAALLALVWIRPTPAASGAA